MKAFLSFNPPHHRCRREFLGQVGQGMMIASIGYEVASGLGLSSAMGAEKPAPLHFGKLEPLVALMQDTPAKDLIPKLAQLIQSGTPLRDLVSAGALANARTFGGEDYVGYHTAMALMPAWHMSQEMTGPEQALPVLKVLYRNSETIQGHGGHSSEVLHTVMPATLPANGDAAKLLLDAVRSNNMENAESTFAAIASQSADSAFNAMLHSLHDDDEVHRVGLAYRSWDLLSLVGMEHAQTMLRQSVRYCVNSGDSAIKNLLPKALEEHHLEGKTPGTRQADDAWVDQLSRTIFESSAADAANAVAAALAEGFSPADVGEAITLAANHLILRDHGRTPEMEAPGKPIGTVHGDSIGLHAMDSANAWRNIARAANTRNTFASLIVGAHQVAKDRVQRGGDFLRWKTLPLENQIKNNKATDPAAVLRELDSAIRSNMQARAVAQMHRYSELKGDLRPALDLLRSYAISEDGALHAEKFYHTCTDEFSHTRPAFQWRHMLALARVTASEYGRPAAGIAQAREALKV